MLLKIEILAKVREISTSNEQQIKVFFGISFFLFKIYYIEDGVQQIHTINMLYCQMYRGKFCRFLLLNPFTHRQGVVYDDLSKCY